MFEAAEGQALLLRMMREAAGILGARWDKVPERQRPQHGPEQRFRILRIRGFRRGAELRTKKGCQLVR